MNTIFLFIVGITLFLCIIAYYCGYRNGYAKQDKTSYENSAKENSNVTDETNAPTEYGKYVDECLNDASKHFFSEGEDKYSVADLFYAGVRCGKSWFEKQLKLSMKVYTKDNTVFIIAKRVGYYDKYTNSYRFTDWEYDYDHPYYFRDEAYEALMYKRNHSDGHEEYKCDERI